MCKAINPLLLDPSFWKERLTGALQSPASMLSSPREDLSGGGRRVEEFRMRAHDGVILWGLISFPTLFAGSRPCCIRSAGPADPVALDPESVESGLVEILYQAPAGRKLEDRVLDLLRIREQVRTRPDIRAEATSLQARPPARHHAPQDEILIASELLRVLPGF